jgi:hypothetical protein
MKKKVLINGKAYLIKTRSIGFRRGSLKPSKKVYNRKRKEKTEE